MPCISRKLFASLNCYLVLIVLLNNLQFSASSLSSTVPSVQSSNFSSSHEPICSNVKDILTQRGIADKDLPAKFPIKGEQTLDI